MKDECGRAIKIRMHHHSALITPRVGNWCLWGKVKRTRYTISFLP